MGEKFSSYAVSPPEREKKQVVRFITGALHYKKGKQTEESWLGGKNAVKVKRRWKNLCYLFTVSRICRAKRKSAMEREAKKACSSENSEVFAAINHNKLGGERKHQDGGEGKHMELN